jgi:hypothetical protein
VNLADEYSTPHHQHPKALLLGRVAIISQVGYSGEKPPSHSLVSHSNYTKTQKPWLLVLKKGLKKNSADSSQNPHKVKHSQNSSSQPKFPELLFPP